MSDHILELIDTHVHFDLDDFDSDREALLERSISGIFPQIGEKTLETGSIQLHRAINPGISVESSRLAIDLAQTYPFIYAAVAIHPNYTALLEENDWKKIERLAQTPKVVAIGETGLDRHWDKSPFSTQKEWFFRHIDLAKRLNLPIIIHCREAIDDLLPILRQIRSDERISATASAQLRGTVHSFSEGPEAARELVEMGFYLGFTGSVTYTQKKFAPLWEAARIVPADRILLETDSPFLIPHPFRGKLERNEPLMTAFVARRLAELRGTTVTEVVRQTTENARRLFTRIN